MPGVGPRSEETLLKLGLRTVADLAVLDAEMIVQLKQRMMTMGVRLRTGLDRLRENALQMLATSLPDMDPESEDDDHGVDDGDDSVMMVDGDI